MTSPMAFRRQHQRGKGIVGRLRYPPSKPTASAWRVNCGIWLKSVA
ncbi:MAG: hypothetical protein U0401_26015 [Anaerolineae bacterium]